MAIRVNEEEFPWREGLTVEAVIAEKKFSFPLKTVFVNGRRIPKVEQADLILKDGDELSIIHMMSGG